MDRQQQQPSQQQQQQLQHQHQQPPRDRTRIGNPNFPPRQAPPPYSSYAPAHPTQPPPSQQSAYDPFPRRDPFMPAPPMDRRDASSDTPHYRTGDGINGPPRMSDHQQRETLQPAHPPPLSPFHTNNAGLFRDEHTRRRSVGGGYNNGQPEHHPPPPPPPAGHSSFMNRHMPPPSASPQPPPAMNGFGPPPRPSPSFNTARDGPGSFPGHRHSSSMSISSIMGGPEIRDNNGRTSWGPLTARAAGPISYSSHSSPHPEYGSRDSSGPPKPPSWMIRDHAPPNGDSSSRLTSSPKSHSAQTRSPEANRQNISHLLHPNTSNGPPQNGVPPRPYSQPVVFNNPGQNAQDVSAPAAAAQMRRPDEASGVGREHSEDTQGKSIRDRSASDLDGRKGSTFGAPFARLPHQSPFHQGPDPSRQWYSAWKGDQDRMPQHMTEQPRVEQRDNSFPPLPQAVDVRFGSANAHGQVLAGSQPPERIVHTPSGPYSDGRPEIRPNSVANDRFGLRGPPRGSVDEHQQAGRSLLSASFDGSKRLDRASPMPQAVQGAQAQPAGSGRDPSVKNEFGRMFSGLGSGVGGTPQPVAAPASRGQTPAGKGPVAEDAETEQSGRKARIDGSRAKRANDDEGVPGNDSGDGNNTPTGSAPDSKKLKLGHSAHHHHHHPHLSVPVRREYVDASLTEGRHHHHHRKPEEEQPGRPRTTTPFNAFKVAPAIAPVTNVAAPPHHHHHHHHPPHHHHHPAKTAPTTPTTSAPVVRKPSITVKTSPLLATVSHLQRRHLGSQLYNPKVRMPNSTQTTLDSKHYYATVSGGLPRFIGFLPSPPPSPAPDAPEPSESITTPTIGPTTSNCTFTIRVPRHFLTASSLQTICAERQIWGTEVYTDDSDPLCAAVHSGWIRGSWSADVDQGMLDIDGDSTPDAPHAAAPPTTGAPPEPLLLTSPPPNGPQPPPSDLDLHLTLLLLPPLEKYSASSWRGVRSRAWGGNHDGGSFKVHKLEWVDEGAEGRYQERGGEARRKRLMGLALGARGISVTSPPRSDGLPAKMKGRAAEGVLGLKISKPAGAACRVSNKASAGSSAGAVGGSRMRAVVV